MSGDVQPRRRKDKKRKRDDRKSEGEVIFSRKQSLQEDDESSHGVHSANMGADDQHIHVQEDHGTGGNWYQKCAFIVLMAILLGLVGLIIVENRGLADLDTPLSESRYSDYLHGWVEEHREEHDDHDEVQASIEEHDELDEPFEEEEDHSEADDEEKDEDDHDDEHDEDDDEDDDHDKDADAEDEEASEEATADQTGEVDDDEDVDEEEDDDDDDNEQVVASQADDDDEEEVVSNEAGDDDDDDDNVTNEDDDDENVRNNEEDDDEDNDDDDDVALNGDDDDNDDDDENNTEEEAAAASPEADDNQDDDEGDDDDGDNEDGDDNNQADDNDESVEPSSQASKSRHSKDNDFDDPFDEDDDDGTAESFESIVVDNDAEEKMLLQEKHRRWAEQNQPPKDDNKEDEPEEGNSFFANLAVKFGVGVALALVARFVLMRKNPNTNAEPSAEELMKRRLTISSAEVTYPEDEDAPPLSEDEEQHVSGEELEMEEEIEYVEEEEEIEIELDEQDQEIPSTNKYVPETFEDFNAMYRSKNNAVPESSSRVEEIKIAAAAREQEAPITSKKSPAVFTAPPPPPLVEAKIQPKQDAPAAKVSFGHVEPAASTKTVSTPMETTTREVTHDIDYQPDEDDIDYTDEDNDYDEDDEIVEEEEEEIEDLLDDDGSDVDDTELMKRLEAKYGRLPTNEYESDEDPDDPTWTQIKPKQTPGGGPQTQDDDFYTMHNKIRHEPNPNIYEDDEYEREMAFANDELLRGNHIAALVTYFRITQNYPDRPMGFLGKAQLSNQLGKMKKDTGFMLQSVDAYKRYLAFDDLITNNMQFQEAAEECIEMMRELGQLEPAITIHRILINRHPHDPEIRNQMLITFLMMDRYYDAKIMLLEIHKKWPQNGFTLALLGYVLKTHDSNYTGAAHYLQLGIDSNAKGTQDARFYIALGESYERLGKLEASFEVYKRGAELKLYPSAHQRSVYNELNLRAQPTWSTEETSNAKNFKEIASQWQAIRNEATAMLEGGGYFQKEMENLVANGNWKELELFSRGVRNHRNCQKAPTTCTLIEQFPAAAKCRRGQVKFSVMHPGTHVRPHCGPTNCRLRAHLGLIVPSGTKLRVASQNISWTEGAFLIFDDSFEHEVWHEGKHIRLILIVDFWHPDLSKQQIARLSTI